MRGETDSIDEAMAAANPECPRGGEVAGQMIGKDGTRFYASGADTSTAGAEPSVDELGERMFP